MIILKHMRRRRYWMKKKRANNATHKKEDIIDGLLDVYNENSLKETDECAILNALEYLGYDIQMI